MTDTFSFPLTARSVPFFADLEKIDSTNSFLSRSDLGAAYSVVLSTQQTAGRGRKNRQWMSHPGESLAVSILVPRAESALLVDSWIPLLVGTAFVDTLTHLGVENVGLKWPNDVLVGGKKLAGVLCEAQPDGEVVAGVGINLRFSGPPPTPQAASLGEIMKFRADTPDIVTSTLITFLKGLLKAEAAEKQHRVSGVTLTVGRRVEVLEVIGDRWFGLAERLDSQGHLVVRDEAGGHHVLAAADVEHLYQ